MLNTMETDTTLLQRRLLVLGSSLIILWFWIEGFVGLWLHVSGSTGYIFSGIFLSAIIISFICQYRLYSLNSIRVASVSDKELDERQKVVRDQAYRRAYQILTFLVLITFFLMVFSVSMNMDTYLYQSWGGIGALFISLLWSMKLLPTWIVAWTERGN